MARHVITPLYACSFDLTHDEYQTRYEELAADGYRLLMIDGYRGDKLLYYGGIWIRDQAAVHTRGRHGLTSSEYQTEYDALREQGYQLKGVTGLSSPFGSTEATFAAVWNDGNWRGYHTHHNMTSSSYQTKFNEYKADGYQVIYVTGYASGMSSRYAAIWSNHTDRLHTARHNLPSSQYQATYDDLKNQGYRIAHVNAHEAGAVTYFAGIWVKEDGYEPTSNHNMSSETFEDLCAERAADDWRLTCIGGYREGGQNRHTAIWIPHTRTFKVHGRSQSSTLNVFDAAIESYMKEPDRRVPGASLAITRNGELVLARGYSWTTDIEPPVEPTSLFRLASVSKTLTGAAIVLLAEEGKLSLTDKVVNLITMPGTIADTRVNDIKVEELLHHVGGWDREVSTDPMKNDLEISTDLNIPLPITQESIIRWQNGKTLDFTPGTFNGYKYSNYGYMLLGMIIETVSGMPYETYVQQRLLEPLGIRRMRLGRTLLRDRVPGEVLYHSTSYGLYKNIMVDGAPENVMSQYGSRNIENIAAHGGWLGTAVDLVRFASAFDEPASCPILSASSVNKLFAQHAYGDIPTISNAHYGCGWYVRRSGTKAGQSHGGTIEGTKTEVARWQDSRTGDSFCSAILFNRYNDALSWDLLTLIGDAMDAVTSWPSTGFWEDYI